MTLSTKQAQSPMFVLKIRRRKFQKTPQQGEIVVTRRSLPYRR